MSACSKLSRLTIGVGAVWEVELPRPMVSRADAQANLAAIAPRPQAGRCSGGEVARERRDPYPGAGHAPKPHAPAGS